MRPNTERRQDTMNTTLCDNIDWVGVIDWTIRDFHSYDTYRGTTYNAYLVRDEKTALVDTVKSPFDDELLRNVASLVEEVLSLVRPSCLHAGIDLKLTTPGDCPNFRLSENGTVPLVAVPPERIMLNGDPESLRQLVTNLVLNAVDAAAAHPSVSPRSPLKMGTGSEPTDANPAKSAGREVPVPICQRAARVLVDIERNSADVGSIRVRDTGQGPPPSIHDQLFHSFVTTKPDGFGLGLYVAHQIAERHGGRLHWQREGDMTCFVFDFPLEL